LDEKGLAEGKLFTDDGDGWGFRRGDYCLLKFTAKRVDHKVIVRLNGKEGNRKVEKEIKKINVEVLLNGKIYKASGSLKGGIKVTIR